MLTLFKLTPRHSFYSQGYRYAFDGPPYRWQQMAWKDYKTANDKFRDAVKQMTDTNKMRHIPKLFGDLCYMLDYENYTVDNVDELPTCAIASMSSQTRFLSKELLPEMMLYKLSN